MAANADGPGGLRGHPGELFKKPMGPNKHGEFARNDQLDPLDAARKQDGPQTLGSLFGASLFGLGQLQAPATRGTKQEGGGLSAINVVKGNTLEDKDKRDGKDEREDQDKNDAVTRKEKTEEELKQHLQAIRDARANGDPVDAAWTRLKSRYQEAQADGIHLDPDLEKAVRSELGLDEGPAGSLEGAQDDELGNLLGGLGNNFGGGATPAKPSGGHPPESATASSIRRARVLAKRTLS